MSAHTTGPWFINENQSDCGSDKLSIEANAQLLGEDYFIAQVDHCISQKENARLIAAAPELLDALKDALAVIKDYLEYDHNGDPWTEDARAMGEMDINDYKKDGRLDRALAAITKATGGE